MSGIGKWDGASWSQVGGGVSGTGVRSLRVFDDGYGPALYVAGPFSLAGGVSINHIAKWDGSQWSALGAGLNSADSLGAFDDDLDGTEDLYVSTGSVVAGTQVSGFTIWRGCACTVESYCTAGTTTNGCTPTISANGWPSIAQTSGFTIEVADVEGQKQGLLFYGVSGAHDASWGAGSTSYLCVKSPTQRMPTQSSGGSAGQCDGALATDWLDYLATHPTALGQPFSAGASVWCQAWFRDPPSPKTTNLSNGLLFTTCP
jgi:hypothetical protein